MKLTCNTKIELKKIIVGNQEVQLAMPNSNHFLQSHIQHYTHHAYWAKVWHSAVGLSLFLDNNKPLITCKNILELAAGLGLPSIVASTYATSVHCTDVCNDAITYITKSIYQNNKKNITCATLNWNDEIDTKNYDVVLLSDVNYALPDLEVLQVLIMKLLASNIMVIIATPQRQIAANFLTSLLPYCTQQYNSMISYNNTVHEIFIYVLHQ